MQLIHAIKKKNNKEHHLTMIVDLPANKIYARAKRSKIYIKTKKKFTGDPTTITNIQATISDAKVWMKNGDIQKVAYLLLYLKLPLVSIDTIPPTLSISKQHKLLNTISTKIKEKNKKRTKETPILINETQNNEFNKKKSVNTGTTTSTSIDSALDHLYDTPTTKDDNKHKKENNKSNKKKETVTTFSTIVNDKEKNQEIETWNTTSSKVGTSEKKKINKFPEENNITFDNQTLDTILSEIQEKISHNPISIHINELKTIQSNIQNAKETNNISDIQHYATQAIKLMETIELEQVNNQEQHETDSYTQSLESDINIIKEYDQRKEEKGSASLLSFFRSKRLQHIKQNIVGRRNIIATIQKGISRILIFVVLELGIYSVFQYTDNIQPTSSTTNILSIRGIRGLAIVIWSRTKQKSSIIQLLSLPILIIFAIIGTHLL